MIGIDERAIDVKHLIGIQAGHGTPSLESLQWAQEVWVRKKQVRSPVDLQRLVDDQLLQKALVAVGRAS